MGRRPLTARLGRPTVVTVGVLAASGLLLAAAPSTGPGADLVRWAVAEVPGAGLLRDAQKWIAPLVALTAWTAGAAVDRGAAAVTTRGTATARLRVPAGVAAAALPLLLLPGGPRTVAAAMQPAHYPADWAAVRSVLHRDTGHGAVAVLPSGSYRRFDWAGGRTVLDPAPRLLDTRVVVDDTLTVGTATVAGEDRTAAAVRTAFGRGDPAALTAAGIGWVLVERGQPTALPSLTGLEPVYDGAELTLLRVPGDPAPASRAGAVPVVVAHLAWVLVLVVGVGAGVARRRRVDGGPPGPC